MDWESVLDALKADGSNSGNYYLLVTGKGSADEKRSRFLTHKEALETVIYEIEKSRLQKGLKRHG